MWFSKQQATDQTYLDKINSHHDENDLYVKPKTERLEFSVQHYAAQVTYSVRGFIQKNKDMLRSDIVDLLCSSKNKVRLIGILSSLAYWNHTFGVVSLNDMFQQLQINLKWYIYT